MAEGITVSATTMAAVAWVTAAALKGGRQGQQGHCARDHDAVGRGVGEQAGHGDRALEGAGRDADQAEPEASQRAEDGDTPAAPDPGPQEGQEQEQDPSREGEPLLPGFQCDLLVGTCRQPERHEADHDGSDPRPLPAGQWDLQPEGRRHRRDGQCARGEGLDDEQGQGLQGDHGQQESGPVESEADEVGHRSEQTDQQPGVQALAARGALRAHGLQDSGQPIADGDAGRCEQREVHPARVPIGVDRRRCARRGGKASSLWRWWTWAGM